MNDQLSNGRGSWYSQFKGKYLWKDDGDEPNSNALGVPDNCQGISFYDHNTLGHWFEVHAPNGKVSIEQQTEIGPAPWTNRKIDISAVAAERFGYSPKNFPTDAHWSWKPIEPPAEVTAITGPSPILRARKQARAYYDLRNKPKPSIMDINSDVAD